MQSLLEWTGLICLSLSMLVVILVIFLIHKKLRYWKDMNVPYVKPMYIFGNTLQRLGLTMPFYEFLDKAYYSHGGRRFCGYFDLLTPGVMVSSPHLLRRILVRDFDHFSSRITFRLGKGNPIANEMLTNASGAHWRAIRSVVSPTFTVSRSRSIHPLVLERAEHLRCNAGSDRCCLESKTLCDKYMIDSIASCAFGIQVKAGDCDMTGFSRMAAGLLQLSWGRALKVVVLVMMPWVTDFIVWLGYKFTSPEFEFFRRIVKYTIETRSKTGAWRGDFLDLMVDTKKLSADCITAQSVLFLLAGYANTSSGMSFALHLLAHHPQYQTALRRELAVAKNRCGGVELSYDCLMSLPLLSAVLNETLRLYPGGPIIERVCTKDYNLRSSPSITIRKGQPLLVPVWSIHRDPDNWEQPELFLPDRFLPQNKHKIHPYTFLPFGVGPRSCVGTRFAEMAIKQGLATLLTSFVVNPCSKHTVHPPPVHPRILTLKPGNTLPLSFTRISNLHDTLRQEMMEHPPSHHLEEPEVVRELYHILDCTVNKSNSVNTAL